MPTRIRAVVAEVDQEHPHGGLQSGERIEGAHLELHCPGRRAVILGESDEYGRFAHRGAKEIESECALKASRSGYYPRTYEVDDICARSDGDDHCEFVSVTVRLHKAEGGP